MLANAPQFHPPCSRRENACGRRSRAAAAAAVRRPRSEAWLEGHCRHRECYEYCEPARASLSSAAGASAGAAARRIAIHSCDGSGGCESRHRHATASVQADKLRGQGAYRRALHGQRPRGQWRCCTRQRGRPTCVVPGAARCGGRCDLVPASRRCDAGAPGGQGGGKQGAQQHQGFRRLGQH